MYHTQTVCFYFVCKELSCNELHVEKCICGELIRAYILNANKVKADSLSVVHMDCAEVDVEDCYINYKRYYKLKATNISCFFLK